MYTSTSNNIYRRFVSPALLQYQRTIPKKRQPSNACRFVGHMLGESPVYIQGFISDNNSTRMQLLKELAKKYNKRNAELPTKNRESKTELFQIYEALKKPTSLHLDIVRKSDDDFGSLKKIFSLAEDKKSLEFVLKLLQEILIDEPKAEKTVIKLLSSKHRLMYAENIEQFKSYLQLNSGDEKAIDKLDTIIDKKQYDRKNFDSKLAIERLLEFKTVRDYVEPYENALAKHYTRERGRFLWGFTKNYLYNKCEPESITKNDILELCKTTNESNIKLRLDILDNFKYFMRNNHKSEVKELKKLFRIIEHNDEVRKFVTKSVKQGFAVNSVSELNEVIKKAKLHKANYFFDNLRRIVAFSDGAERQKAIVNEIENPFYKPIQKRTDGIYKSRAKVGDYGLFEKIQVYISNKIKVFIYNNFESKAEDLLTQKQTPKLKLKTIANPRKIQLQKDVNDMIKNKLGKRVYEAQEDNYRLKATKIRLGLLPDIFDSIKVTRAQYRKKGITPSVSNKDASRLYELINGTNRKTVRYLLRICDNDGNRVFDVKHIIELIEKANKDIREAKAIKPNYRAADTKTYYENLYVSLNSKYGKLKRTTKVKAE